MTLPDGSAPTMRGAFGPETPIPGLPGLTAGDFWSWAYANLLENTVRPVFAEFIVGTLLGVVSNGRKAWDAVDLHYRGRAIEVKSSAFVQAWSQTRPSPIHFDIASKLPWDQTTNTWSAASARSADCYVFCLYPEQDRARAHPLDVTAWQFWVLPTPQINAVFGPQARVALSRIQPLTPAVGAAELRTAIHAALGLVDEGSSARAMETPS